LCLTIKIKNNYKLLWQLWCDIINNNKIVNGDSDYKDDEHEVIVVIIKIICQWWYIVDDP